MRSDGFGTAAPMPPKRRPNAPRRSSMPKWRRAGASTKAAADGESARTRGGRVQFVAHVVGEERHGFVLAGTGRLVDDHLQPLEVAEYLGGGEQMRAGRKNGGFEDGVSRPVEAEELALGAVMHNAGLDARARRCGIDGDDVELAPRARRVEHDSLHAHGRVGGERRSADRGAREYEDVVGQVHDGCAGGADVVKGGRLEERFDHQHVIAPIDAHGGNVDASAGVDAGEDGLDDHARHSRATREANASATRAVTGPGAPLGIAWSSARAMGAISRIELVRNASSAAARSRGRRISSRVSRPIVCASSRTAARVIPGSTPQASAGVQSVEPVTRKRLLAVASDRWPAVSRNSASSAPAALACARATTASV